MYCIGCTGSGVIFIPFIKPYSILDFKFTLLGSSCTVVHFSAILLLGMSCFKGTNPIGSIFCTVFALLIVLCSKLGFKSIFSTGFCIVFIFFGNSFFIF